MNSNDTEPKNPGCAKCKFLDEDPSGTLLCEANTKKVRNYYSGVKNIKRSCSNVNNFLQCEKFEPREY